MERHSPGPPLWNGPQGGTDRKVQVDNLPQLPARRLQTLLEVSRLLASTLELDEILDILMSRAGAMIGCEGTSLLLLDPTGKYLEFAVAKGDKGKALKEHRLPMGAGVAGWVAQHGRPLLVKDVREEPRFFAGCDQETGFETRSLMAAPLYVRDRVIGVIEAVNSTRPDGFEEEDLAFFAPFANYAAIAIENARLYATVSRERESFKGEVAKRYQIVGSSPALARVLEMAKTVADSSATVLLLGESGTGKEMFARAIHHGSPRASQPFVAVNCAALSQELLASELFGHEKGAFTGATRRRAGRFEQAEGGTLFLDEVGDAPPSVQVRLLQEREFERVGGTRIIPADIRVIAASNRDIEQEVKRGNFREDLYYRLNVVVIRLPALRERREDIDGLAAFFLQKHAKESGKNLKTISEEALEALRSYAWPGNVRELENVIQRGIILSRSEQIGPAHLPAEVCGGAAGAPAGAAPRTNEELKEAKRVARDRAAEEVERRFLERILRESRGNVTQAAASAGINRTLLQQLLKKYDINRSRFRQ